MKILLLVLLVLVVIWLARGSRGRSQTAPAGRKLAGEAMCQCAHCGAYFPASEAVAAPSGAVFCCEEHRLRNAHS
jgi:uncharacterized protein